VIGLDVTEEVEGLKNEKDGFPGFCLILLLIGILDNNSTPPPIKLFSGNGEGVSNDVVFVVIVVRIGTIVRLARVVSGVVDGVVVVVILVVVVVNVVVVVDGVVVVVDLGVVVGVL
jgi:hypothetical protein